MCAFPSVSFSPPSTSGAVCALSSVSSVSEYDRQRHNTQTEAPYRSRSGKLYSIQLYGHRLCRQYPITAFIASASVVFGTLRLDARFFFSLSLSSFPIRYFIRSVWSHGTAIYVFRVSVVSLQPSLSLSLCLSVDRITNAYLKCMHFSTSYVSLVPLRRCALSYLTLARSCCVFCDWEPK